MSYLSFIENAELEKIIATVLDKGREAITKTEKQFGRNVIDPFTIIFEIASFEINAAEWRSNEKVRQAQKTLSNHLGNFHQKILGSLNGWQNLDSGQIVDIVNHNTKIIGEVKNKHNTLKGSDKSSMYYTLEDLVMRKGHMYKGYTAYYIEIVPKNPKRYNKVFTPSDPRTGGLCQANPLIKQIDGFSFYALATGVDNALEQLFTIIPTVISHLKPEFTTSMQQNNEFVQSFFKTAFQVK